MCGILFVLNPKSDVTFNDRLEELVPRGPDETNYVISDDFIAGHTRNCITSPMKGKQPIEDNRWVIVHNGEIYNRSDLNKSDSFVILDMLKKHGPIDAPKYLDGIFGYVAYDTITKQMYAARDPVGVIPLYLGLELDETKWVSNEIKALYGLNDVKVIPPGHVYANGEMIRYTTPYPEEPPSTVYIPCQIRDLVFASVEKRLYLDVPWGMLLSGGVDSSIIATVIKECDLSNAKWKTFHTFSIGLEDSPDLEKARKMADEMDSVHHEYVFTVEEGLRALRDVIYAIESYDVTTIRASVPMYLLGQYIRKCGVKVVFSGEGSDELFAGYLYNKWCPDRGEMHKECVTKMERLHYHDCMRANKTMACHGIECRVPFLDKDLVQFAMHEMDPRYKLSGTHPDGPRDTKWILRDEFKHYLPEELLYRKKEQFSDGVGSKWIDALKAHAESVVYDFDKAVNMYPYQTPQTKEAFLYRSIFYELFGKIPEKTVLYSNDSCACSSERGMQWNSDFKKDPSAKDL
jgi:asparagine synthase (glutamine-hydrolysing)